MSSNKKCLIIHGCPSDVEKVMDSATITYDKHWLPWLKKKITELKHKNRNSPHAVTLAA